MSDLLDDKIYIFILQYNLYKYVLLSMFTGDSLRRDWIYLNNVVTSLLIAFDLNYYYNGTIQWEVCCKYVGNNVQIIYNNVGTM